MQELSELILAQKSELKEVVGGFAQGKPEVVTGSLVTLLAGLATGHPELSIMSPLAHEGVRRAFALTAQGQLDQVLKAHAEDERQIVAAEAIAGFLGQALGQLVEQQRNIDDGAKSELQEALGGLRADFAAFRSDFQAAVPADVLVATQHVSGRGIGVRVGAASQKRVRVVHQVVSDDAVGVDV